MSSMTCATTACRLGVSLVAGLAGLTPGFGRAGSRRPKSGKTCLRMAPESEALATG